MQGTDQQTQSFTDDAAYHSWIAKKEFTTRHTGDTGTVAHKFDPPQQNISTTTNHPILNYTMNRTTTTRAATTPSDHHEDDSHYFTPARAKVHGAFQFSERMEIDYFKKDIFRTFNVGSREGWRFLSDRNSSRRVQNDPDVKDHPGPQPLIGPEQTREMEPILETEGIEPRAYTWEQLGFGVGLECSGRTAQRAMGAMNYHKCIACRRGWVNDKTAKDRMNWATVMLERYPHPED